MNNKELDHAIKVMQAYRDGKAVQTKVSGGGWVDLKTCEWDFVGHQYRIKPTGPYRPYEISEEFRKGREEHGPNVAYPGNAGRSFYTTSIDDEQATAVTVYHDFGCVTVDFEALFENYVWTDNTPCGTLNTENNGL